MSNAVDCDRKSIGTIRSGEGPANTGKYLHIAMQE
jgi:hypothetical protein